MGKIVKAQKAKCMTVVPFLKKFDQLYSAYVDDLYDGEGILIFSPST